jgi:hypothetical protein
MDCLTSNLEFIRYVPAQKEEEKERFGVRVLEILLVQRRRQGRGKAAQVVNFFGAKQSQVSARTTKWSGGTGVNNPLRLRLVSFCFFGGKQRKQENNLSVRRNSREPANLKPGLGCVAHVLS